MSAFTQAAWQHIPSCYHKIMPKSKQLYFSGIPREYTAYWQFQS